MKKAAFLVVLFVLAWSGAVLAQESQPAPQDLYEGRAAAPEFPPGLDWLNVDRPLTMQGLRGKIVILDFWTYGCINCIHMIPVLERIEEKYADEVVVIGVHSAKFETEGQTDNLRQIVQRYDLRHPVINDNAFMVWRTYGARAWPTAVIIDPRGNVVVRESGEIPFAAFDAYLSGMAAYYDGLDETIIDRTPLEVTLEGAGDPGTPLLFPGKVLADEASQRLFIADSNHNRIVVVDLMTHEVLDIIGAAARGFDNGGFDSARFDKPQGMALDGDRLYIADVNNHAIREANLTERTVRTVAGSGEMGRGYIRFGAQITAPLEAAIRSPWDVELDEDGWLHIAMAGTHQLYIFEPASNLLYPSVGNGREANLNDVRLAESELAQPSGLFFAGGGKLYFADSESSTIRLADFENDRVTVVAGTTANNLFDFGDIDGELGENRLQHALGVQGVPGGDLYIADTYNSRIKVIPAGETAVRTVFGLGGSGGYADGDAAVAQFDEPGGLSYANGLLYVADTNNHVIRTIDLASGLVDTLAFRNPEALVIDAEALTILGSDSAMVALETQDLATGAGKIALRLGFPSGFKINPLIDSRLELSSQADALRIEDADEAGGLVVTVNENEVRVPVTFAAGQGELKAALTLYYCREGEAALCFIETVDYIVPFRAAADHNLSEIALTREIAAPDGF